MTAEHPTLAELRERGAFGELSLNLLAKVARSVVRAYGFPPPDGREEWTRTDIADVVRDWAFDEKSGERRVRAVLAAVTTDDGLRRYLSRSMTNHFRSQGRKTEFGARLLAVRAHVHQDDRIVVTADPDTYSLQAHVGQPPHSGEHQPLVEAAADVAVVLLPYETQQRRQPIATHATVIGIVAAVLHRADAPVMEDVIVNLVLHRCGVAWQFTETEFVPREHDHVGAADDADESPGPPAAAAVTADAVWAVLDPRQRLLVHALVDGMTVRQIEETLGVARQTAQRTLERLKLRLGELFGNSGGAAVAALADVTARSRALASGTTLPGVASPPVVKAPS